MCVCVCVCVCVLCAHACVYMSKLLTKKRQIHRTIQWNNISVPFICKFLPLKRATKHVTQHEGYKQYKEQMRLSRTQKAEITINIKLATENNSQEYQPADLKYGIQFSFVLLKVWKK